MPFKGPIDANLFKDYFKKELQNILATKEKPIVFFWDKNILPIINLFFTHNELQSFGVEKSFFIDAKENWSTPENAKSVIFFLKSNIELIKVISDVVYREAYQRALAKKYYILAIRKLDKACESLLNNNKTKNLFKDIESIGINLLPLDGDVFSMENLNTFSDFALYEKLESFYDFAKGLMTLQKVYGLFPSILSIGENSHNISKYLMNLHNDYKTSKDNPVDLNSIPRQFDQLIIFERTLDPISPLLYQLTYEGLIQERYGFYCGNVQIPILPSEFTNKDKKIALNSSDPFYVSIRDMNFSKIGAFLNRKSRELKSQVDMTREAKGLSELKKIVNYVPEIRRNRQSLEIHTLIATDLQNYTSSETYLSTLYHQQSLVSGADGEKLSSIIEEMILLQKPISESLRLMCIQSLCNGGIKRATLDYYKKLIIDSYGFNHVTTIMNLEKAGLLCSPIVSKNRKDVNTLNSFQADICTRVGSRISGISYAYATSLRRNFRLIYETVEDEEEVSNNLEANLADPFVTYIPLSIRILQILLDIGWNQNRFFNPQETLTNTLNVGRKLVSQLKSSDDRNNLLVGSPSSASNSQSDCNPLNQTIVHSSNTKEEIRNPILNLLPEGENSIKQHYQLPNISSYNENANNSRESKLILVAFLGGVTHGEIACLRNLASYSEGRVEFAVATTGIVDHLTILDNLSDPIKIN